MIWVLILVLVAIVSGWLGFFGVSDAMAGVAKFLFVGCLGVIAIVLFAAKPLTKPKSERDSGIGPGEDAPRH